MSSVKKKSKKIVAASKPLLAKPPIDIPRMNNMTMGSALHPFIFPEDIDILAAQSGVKISPGIDKDKIAYDIYKALELSISYSGTGDNRPSPSNLKKWFDSLNSKSESLLKHLGFDNSKLTLQAYKLIYAPRGGHSFPVFQAGVSNLTDALYVSKVKIPAYPLLPQEVQELKGVKGALNVAFDATDGQSSQDLMEEDSKLLSIQLLRASPWIISLIAEMSREMALFYGEHLGPAGRKKNAFQAGLFVRLVEPYREMTGRLPTARVDKDRDPEAPAVRWTKALFDLALHRLEALTHPPGAAAIESVRTLTNMQPTTVADHIERGRTLAKRLEAKLKKVRLENGFHEN